MQSERGSTKKVHRGFKKKHNFAKECNFLNFVVLLKLLISPLTAFMLLFWSCIMSCSNYYAVGTGILTVSITGRNRYLTSLSSSEHKITFHLPKLFHLKERQTKTDLLLGFSRSLRPLWCPVIAQAWVISGASLTSIFCVCFTETLDPETALFYQQYFAS